METARPLIARQRELQVLDDCLASARAGRARLALIHGESGLGKTRLADSLVERARESGVFVAQGHCTPVSGGELPFGPFVEVLSGIGSVRSALDRAGGTPWELLRTALSVSTPSSGLSSPDTGLERSRLFTSVRWVLHELAEQEQQPVLLVLEDIHWADSSSLDLLNYLARTAGQERLLLVLTCRDDALARNASTRKGVRELSRAEMSRDIHLGPFSANQVRELLATSDVQLPAAQHDKVVDLCDGNPFMALELAARDEIEGAHTEALRQALLGPVDELPDDARFALHVAAVLGEYIPHEVLEKAIESRGGDVATILRLLTERGLLVAGSDRYDFRHAILRESVVREMLHSEQTAAHRAAVQGVRLSRRDGLPRGLAQLAHHLVAAGDYADALPTVISAADHARSMYAFPEARRQLSVAREELWDRVDDPEALSALSYDELLRLEAEMARWAGEPSAAAELLRAGLAAVPRKGLSRARLELELGEALWAAGDPAGTLAACERAEAALEPGPREQVLRVRVLASRAQALIALGQYERCQAVAEEAIALARTCGATRNALQARITLATATARRGDLEFGVAELHRCLTEAVAADAFKAVVRCYGNLAFLHSTAGQLRQVLDVAQEGEHTCRRFGPLLLVAPTLAENWVHALVATGRWDDAQAQAQELEQQWAAEGMALTLHLQLAQVAAARGDEPGFTAEMAIIGRFASTDDPYTVHDVTLASTEHLLWQGKAHEAHRISREALDRLGEQQDAGLVVSLCTVALRAHADLVTSRGEPAIRDVAVGETADLIASARRAAQGDTGALDRAHLLLCEAEAARAALTPSADAWAAVVAEWERLECPYPMAYAQWRQAEALFGVRSRSQGTRVLAAALRTAVELGSTPLEQTVRTLARHAGVPATELDVAPVADGDDDEAVVVHTANGIPVHLTPRERDVLRILTEGFSNQQIARRLFISESTVSVHVSHIIAKLGVSNRLQAASAAQRLNLFPSGQQRV